MEKISLSEKYLLSVPEASEYFGVGIKRMRRIAEGNEGNFTLEIGEKYLVIRHKLEEWFDGKVEKINPIVDCDTPLV